jgi:hypothetical protein
MSTFCVLSLAILSVFYLVTFFEYHGLENLRILFSNFFQVVEHTLKLLSTR